VNQSGHIDLMLCSTFDTDLIIKTALVVSLVTINICVYFLLVSDSDYRF